MFPLDKYFNLTEEGWIPAIDSNGKTVMLSLPELYEQAHLLKRLAGETPTQNVALLRLLMAILYASVFRGPFETPDEALDAWISIWEKGHFPSDITDYLRKWHDRFWLFHEERPFMQVPFGKDGLTMENAAEHVKLEKPGKCTESGIQRASKLNGAISESANKEKLFNSALGEEKYNLSISEAARWLIHVIGFDDGGIKHYYPKDSPMNRGDSAANCSVAWLGSISPVYAEGNTLFETLMLNSVLLKNGEMSDDALWPEQKPSWEDGELHQLEAEGREIPDQPALLCSYLSRRIMLIRKGEKIQGFIRYVGEAFSREGAETEQWTVWSMPKAKKNEAAIPVPRSTRMQAQMWREMGTLLLESDTQRPIPGVVSWNRLLSSLHIPALNKRLCRFHYTKALYDVPKSSNISEILDDEITFSADLLAEAGKAWLTLIKNETDLCSKAAWQINLLARNLLSAEGGEITAEKGKPTVNANSVGNAAEERFYSVLDEKVRNWLRELNAQDDSETRERKITEFREMVIRAALKCGREMVSQTSIVAYNMRRKQEAGERHFTVPEAWILFRRNVHNVYHGFRKGGAD